MSPPKRDPPWPPCRIYTLSGNCLSHLSTELYPCCNLAFSVNISPVRLLTSLVLKPDLINLFVNYVPNTEEV